MCLSQERRPENIIILIHEGSWESHLSLGCQGPGKGTSPTFPVQAPVGQAGSQTFWRVILSGRGRRGPPLSGSSVKGQPQPSGWYAASPPTLVQPRL